MLGVPTWDKTVYVGFRSDVIGKTWIRDMASAKRQRKEERKNQELDSWISQKSHRTEASRQRKEKFAE